MKNLSVKFLVVCALLLMVFLPTNALANDLGDNGEKGTKENQVLNELEPLIEEPELVDANAELLKAWVTKSKFLMPHEAVWPPKVMWFEAIVDATPMAGYLSLVGKSPGGGNYFIYEGYLYNKKYPIPQLRTLEQ